MAVTQSEQAPRPWPHRSGSRDDLKRRFRALLAAEQARRDMFVQSLIGALTLHEDLRQ
jgi:hypothetical protein